MEKAISATYKTPARDRTVPVPIDVVLMNDLNLDAQTKNHNIAIRQIHPICMSGAFTRNYTRIMISLERDSPDLLWVIVFPLILPPDSKHIESSQFSDHCFVVCLIKDPN